MYNVSFSGSPVFINPNKKIANATASELAAVINRGFKQASVDLGREVKPIRKISGKSLMKINPDSFDKTTRKLNEVGKEGFEAVNGRMLGLNLDSKLTDFGRSVKNLVKKIAYFEDDGKTASVSVFFDYFTK